jgi:hypothetical protein
MIVFFPTQLAAISTMLLLFCATVPLACAPGGRLEETRASEVVGRLGGRTARDTGRDGEPIGKVDLAGKPVTDADLNALSGFAHLYDLVLRRTQITDAGLEHLKKTGKLRVLNLDETRVTDAGLVQLGALTSLRGLYLARTDITDAGLESLRSLTKLGNSGSAAPVSPTPGSFTSMD